MLENARQLKTGDFVGISFGLVKTKSRLVRKSIAQPKYSPNLASSDFSLFSNLKRSMRRDTVLTRFWRLKESIEGYSGKILFLFR